MKLRDFTSTLDRASASRVKFVLPDGSAIPAEYHVTEVGHVTRRFIDCGGTIRTHESCLLQAWVSERDRSHRLTGQKLARIFGAARSVLPSDLLELEVEYETDRVSQYSVERIAMEGEELHVQLGNKKTDCLARDACGVAAESGCGCGTGGGSCC